MFNVQEHQIDRAKHEAGVNMRAIRKQHPDAVQIALPHQADQTIAKRGRDID